MQTDAVSKCTPNMQHTVLQFLTLGRFVARILKPCMCTLATKAETWYGADMAGRSERKPQWHLLAASGCYSLHVLPRCECWPLLAAIVTILGIRIKPAMHDDASLNTLEHSLIKLIVK